jgi:hypothetical protein
MILYMCIDFFFFFFGNTNIAFVCCLRQKPQSPSLTVKEIENSKSVVNTPIVDMYENELVQELTQKGLESPSQYGYAYTGRGFVTQESFWFYSCVLMSCINSVSIHTLYLLKTLLNFFLLIRWQYD